MRVEYIVDSFTMINTKHYKQVTAVGYTLIYFLLIKILFHHFFIIYLGDKGNFVQIINWNYKSHFYQKFSNYTRLRVNIIPNKFAGIITLFLLPQVSAYFTGSTLPKIL